MSYYLVLSYTSFQAFKRGHVCAFQFMLLLAFLLISHSVILGGFIYFWCILTSSGESPVFFHTVGQDQPVVWKLWYVTLSCYTCQTGNIQETRYRSKMGASVLPSLRGGNQLPVSEIGSSTLWSRHQVSLSDRKLLFRSFLLKGSQLNLLLSLRGWLTAALRQMKWDYWPEATFCALMGLRTLVVIMLWVLCWSATFKLEQSNGVKTSERVWELREWERRGADFLPYLWNTFVPGLEG